MTMAASAADAESLEEMRARVSEDGETQGDVAGKRSSLGDKTAGDGALRDELTIFADTMSSGAAAGLSPATGRIRMKTANSCLSGAPLLTRHRVRRMLAHTEPGTPTK